ncbi:MAG: YidC/Oxa1 family membrane protein insertase [Chloroflexi bacterium]|nr:YidC/Oxa1 family membrane protein insertase [Chloroflexota bacterium]
MWSQLIVYPFTNTLLLLYVWLGHSFTAALIVLTVGIRILLTPLTARQQKTQIQMQELQPEIKRIQEKYKGEPEKIQKELLKIGYNPAAMLGGCLPTLIQFPILIGVYQAILNAIPSTPLQMMDLYHAVYPWLFPNFNDLLPVNRYLFGVMDLTQPDRIYLPWLPDLGIPILPIFVVLTTFVQQKMMTPPSTADANDASAQMQRSMMTTMPLMFGFFALQFASGLSIYFITSNIAGIGQYAFLNRAKFSWGKLSLPGGISLPWPDYTTKPAAKPRPSVVPPPDNPPRAPGTPPAKPKPRKPRRRGDGA